MGIVIAQRCCHQAFCARFAHVGLNTKCRKMRTHKAAKVDHDTRNGKPKSHPPVACNTRCFLPFWCNRNKVANNQPDKNVGHHGKNHGNGHKNTADNGKRPSCSCKVQDARDCSPPLFIFLLFLIHHTSLLPQRFIFNE